MPWHEFVPVKRAQYDPAAEPLEPAKVIGLGLVLSRFEYNGLPNQRFTPGDFKLQVRVLTLCSADCLLPSTPMQPQAELCLQLATCGLLPGFSAARSQHQVV